MMVDHPSQFLVPMVSGGTYDTTQSVVARD